MLNVLAQSAKITARLRSNGTLRALLRRTANPALGKRLCAVFFLGLVMVCSAGSLKRMIGDRQSFPVIGSWKKLPDRFEGFLTEHLAGRYSLLRWNARLRIDLLGVSPSPRVWIGSDGWLFFNHRAELPAEQISKDNLAASADHWGVLMRSRRDWCEARGCKFLCVVAPDKQSIYPEYLPAAVRNRGDDRTFDRVLAHWKQTPAVPVIDPREELRASKAAGPVYLQADSHWTPFGVWQCYTKMAETLTQWFPDLVPLTVSELKLTTAPMGCCDLWWLLARSGTPPCEMCWWPRPLDPRATRTLEEPLIGDEDRYGHLKQAVWTNPGCQGPRVVLFCDSFADDRFQELLAQHCSRLVVVPSIRMVESVIESERPDLVICEVVERFFVKHRPPLPK